MLVPKSWPGEGNEVLAQCEDLKRDNIHGTAVLNDWYFLYLHRHTHFDVSCLDIACAGTMFRSCIGRVSFAIFGFEIALMQQAQKNCDYMYYAS